MATALPSTTPDGGLVPTAWDDLRWVVTQGAPWVGRRTRDLGPWAARMALSELVGAGRRTRPSTPVPVPVPAAAVSSCRTSARVTRRGATESAVAP